MSLLSSVEQSEAEEGRLDKETMHKRRSCIHSFDDFFVAQGTMILYHHPACQTLRVVEMRAISDYRRFHRIVANTADVMESVQFVRGRFTEICQPLKDSPLPQVTRPALSDLRPEVDAIMEREHGETVQRMKLGPN